MCKHVLGILIDAYPEQWGEADLPAFCAAAQREPGFAANTSCLLAARTVDDLRACGLPIPS